MTEPQPLADFNVVFGDGDGNGLVYEGIERISAGAGTGLEENHEKSSPRPTAPVFTRRVIRSPLESR